MNYVHVFRSWVRRSNDKANSGIQRGACPHGTERSHFSHFKADQFQLNRIELVNEKNGKTIIEMVRLTFWHIPRYISSVSHGPRSGNGIPLRRNSCTQSVRSRMGNGSILALATVPTKYSTKCVLHRRDAASWIVLFATDVR